MELLLLGWSTAVICPVIIFSLCQGRIFLYCLQLDQGTLVGWESPVAGHADSGIANGTEKAFRCAFLKRIGLTDVASIDFLPTKIMKEVSFNGRLVMISAKFIP